MATPRSWKVDGTEKRGLRRSCEVCYKRKRPCDGDENTPCSRCLSKNFPCIFTQKQRTGPKRRYHKLDLKEASASRQERKSVAEWEEDSTIAMTGYRGQMGDVAPPIKMARVSLSPSTALGDFYDLQKDLDLCLVLFNTCPHVVDLFSPRSKRFVLQCGLLSLSGTQEGSFLAAYFLCIGSFVHHVDEATTRSALASFLSGGSNAVHWGCDSDPGSTQARVAGVIKESASEKTQIRPAEGGERSEVDVGVRLGVGGEVKRVKTEDSGKYVDTTAGIKAAAAQSLLWSAVAVGAVVRGLTKRVILEGYVIKSMKWLERCPPEKARGSAIVAAAYVQMACLYQMMGSSGLAALSIGGKILHSAPDDGSSAIEHMKITLGMASNMGRLQMLGYSDSGLQDIVENNHISKNIVISWEDKNKRPEGIYTERMGLGAVCATSYMKLKSIYLATKTSQGDVEHLDKLNQSRRIAMNMEKILEGLISKIGTFGMGSGLGPTMASANLAIASFLALPPGIPLALWAQVDRFIEALELFPGLPRLGLAVHRTHALAAFCFYNGQEGRYTKIQHIHNSSLVGWSGSFNLPPFGCGDVICKGWECNQLISLVQARANQENLSAKKLLENIPTQALPFHGAPLPVTSSASLYQGLVWPSEYATHISPMTCNQHKLPMITKAVTNQSPMVLGCDKPPVKGSLVAVPHVLGNNSQLMSPLTAAGNLPGCSPSWDKVSKLPAALGPHRLQFFPPCVDTSTEPLGPLETAGMALAPAKSADKTLLETPLYDMASLPLFPSLPLDQLDGNPRLRRVAKPGTSVACSSVLNLPVNDQPSFYSPVPFVQVGSTPMRNSLGNGGITDSTYLAELLSEEARLRYGAGRTNFGHASDQSNQLQFRRLVNGAPQERSSSVHHESISESGGTGIGEGQARRTTGCADMMVGVPTTYKLPVGGQEPILRATRLYNMDGASASQGVEDHSSLNIPPVRYVSAVVGTQGAPVLSIPEQQVSPGFHQQGGARILQASYLQERKLGGGTDNHGNWNSVMADPTLQKLSRQIDPTTLPCPESLVQESGLHHWGSNKNEMWLQSHSGNIAEGSGKALNVMPLKEPSTGPKTQRLSVEEHKGFLCMKGDSKQEITTEELTLPVPPAEGAQEGGMTKEDALHLRSLLWE